MSRGIKQPPEIPTVGCMLFHAALIPVRYGTAQLARTKATGSEHFQQDIVAGIAINWSRIELIKIDG